LISKSKKQNSEPIKDNKKRFEPELSTVFEQTSDAEGTLQNKLTSPNMKKESEDSGDREDIDDEDDSTSANTDMDAKRNLAGDFTFIGKGADDFVFDDFSKFRTIEEMRMNLE
jgi:hypothetical protein